MIPSIQLLATAALFLGLTACGEERFSPAAQVMTSPPVHHQLERHPVRHLTHEQQLMRRLRELGHEVDRLRQQISPQAPPW